MKRVIWLVMDSFGIGNANDAEKFGDVGADTLGNISKKYPLKIPNMSSLGLLKAYELNNKKALHVKKESPTLDDAFWGVLKEASAGKDTLSGHWEMAGVVMDVNMRYFEEKTPVFPESMIEEIKNLSGIKDILGNRHAGGIEIIESLGSKHIDSGYPIFYTSADSVLQIAAHEKHFGLEKLYKLCEIAREVSNKYNIGRVIARPFDGENGDFQRTNNRRDYALRPSGKSILEIMSEHKKDVIGIGKIHDIFGGAGITKKVKAYKLDGLMNATLDEMKKLQNEGIIYTNFVDFDMEWGHRRDTLGYAKGLEYFDIRLKEVIDNLKDEDFLIITADHGCDPTFEGSDHTRENVPVFGMLKGRELKEIGVRETFADIANSIASFLKLPKTEVGESFL